MISKKFLLLFLLTNLIYVTNIFAQDQNVDLYPGEVTIIQAPFKITGVKLRGPSGIISAKPSSATEIELTGEQLGQSKLVIRGRNRKEYVVEVNVTEPAQPAAVSPTVQAPTYNNRGTDPSGIYKKNPLKLRKNINEIVVSGETNSSRDAWEMDQFAKAEANAKDSRGKEKNLKVINNSIVGGKNQVQVSLKIIEIQRTNTRELGFDAFGQKFVDKGVTGAGVPVSEQTDVGLFSGGLAPSFNYEGDFVEWQENKNFNASGDGFELVFGNDKLFPFLSAINVLSQKGFAKTLSEPVLVAMSGQTADLLVGGEIPVPIPQGNNAITIQYKPFGIQLNVTPYILDGNEIQLDLNAEISDLNGPLQSFGGVQLRGITTKGASTSVRVKSGEGFAIGGLVQERTLNSVGKVPLLGDIPLIGFFFRKKSSIHEEIELMMIVKAELVGPNQKVDYENIPLEWEYNNPSDVNFFLMGMAEQKGTIAGYNNVGKPARSKPVKRQNVKLPKKSKKTSKQKSKKVSYSPQRGKPAGPVGFIR